MKSLFAFVQLLYAAAALTVSTRGDRDRCPSISRAEAADFVHDYTNLLYRQDKKWRKNAEDLFTKDIKVFADSHYSFLNQPLSTRPITSSRVEFIDNLAKQPKIRDVSTLSIWIDCDTIIWYSVIGKYGPKGYPVKGFAAFTVERERKGKKLRANKYQTEWNSIAQLKGVGQDPFRCDEDHDWDHDWDHSRNHNKDHRD